MKRIVFLTLFCYVLASLSAQIPVSQDIRDAISNYDYEKALNLMKEEPATIPLLYLKGKALKELGRDKEALEVFHLLTYRTHSTRGLTSRQVNATRLKENINQP